MIMLIGDHLGHQTRYYTGKITDPDFQRTPYNAFINPAVPVGNTKNRLFTTVDYYPTIVAGLGFDIAGEQLGLGVNLFSSKPTLAESLGAKKLDTELSKRSDFYDQQLMLDPSQEDH